MKLGSTNISTTTVANALQTSSHDVGTLCRSSNINMWAKGKPVSYATNTGITDAQRSSWPCNHGFNIPTSTSMLLHGSWTYNRPQGGSSSPYRLGDFRGYDTDATPPIESGLPEYDWNVYLTGNMNQTLHVKYNLNGSGQFGGPVRSEISVNDLWANGSKRLSTLYLGVATDDQHWCVSEEPLSAGTGNCLITNEQIQNSSLASVFTSALVGEDITLYYYLTDSSSNSNKWAMPVETKTVIHKMSNFFYRLLPASMTLSFNNYTETIQQGVDKIFGVNFSNAVKNYSSPSTGLINIKMYFRLYAPDEDFIDQGWNQNYTLVEDTLIPNDQVLRPSVNTSNYMNASGQVLETINNSNRDDQGVSRFPKAQPYGSTGLNNKYYNVYLEFNVPMAKFQEYAQMTGMPQAAYFEANFSVGYTGGGTLGAIEFNTDNCLIEMPDFRFKFYGNS